MARTVVAMQTVLIDGFAGVCVECRCYVVALMSVVVAPSATMAILYGQRAAVDESVKELAVCERK